MIKQLSLLMLCSTMSLNNVNNVNNQDLNRFYYYGEELNNGYVVNSYFADELEGSPVDTFVEFCLAVNSSPSINVDGYKLERLAFTITESTNEIVSYELFNIQRIIVFGSYLNFKHSDEQTAIHLSYLNIEDISCSFLCTLEYYNIFTKMTYLEGSGMPTYKLPPFLSIKAEVDSFTYYCRALLHSSNFSVKTITSIRYIYHTALYLDLLDGSTFNLDMSISDDGTLYYFKLDLNYDLSDYDNTISIPTLTLYAYGNEFYNFIDDQFYRGTNPVISGSYNLSISSLLDIYNLDQSIKLTYNFDFFSNGVYYNQLVINNFIGSVSWGSVKTLGVWYVNDTGISKLFVIANTTHETYTNYEIENPNGEDTYLYFNEDGGFNFNYLTIDFKDNAYVNVTHDILIRYFTPQTIKGFGIGSAVSSDELMSIFTLITTAISSFVSLFSIVVFPGITVGILFLIPLIIGILIFIINLFRR